MLAAVVVGSRPQRACAVRPGPERPRRLRQGRRHLHRRSGDRGGHRGRAPARRSDVDPIWSLDGTQFALPSEATGSSRTRTPLMSPDADGTGSHARSTPEPLSADPQTTRSRPTGASVLISDGSTGSPRRCSSPTTDGSGSPTRSSSGNPDRYGPEYRPRTAPRSSSSARQPVPTAAGLYAVGTDGSGLRTHRRRRRTCSCPDPDVRRPTERGSRTARSAPTSRPTRDAVVARSTSSRADGQAPTASCEIVPATTDLARGADRVVERRHATAHRTAAIGRDPVSDCHRRRRRRCRPDGIGARRSRSPMALVHRLMGTRRHR